MLRERKPSRPYGCRSPGERIAPDWTPLREPHSTAPATLGEVWKFLWSVFETAQNYRDNVQAELPSYAERIVQVRLEPNEGGFNLKMPTKIITDVVGKGDKAGTLLRHEFNFDQHQWVRFRMLTEQLDDAFNGLLESERESRDEPAGVAPASGVCGRPRIRGRSRQPSSDASAQRVLLLQQLHEGVGRTASSPIRSRRCTRAAADHAEDLGALSKSPVGAPEHGALERLTAKARARPR